MDADVVRVPADERGRLHRVGARRATLAELDRRRAGPGLRRSSRRPAPPTPVSSTTSRRRGGCGRAARHVAARRRCLRRGRAGRAERPPPLRRHRAGRQLHRRSRTSGCSPRSTRCALVYRDPDDRPRSPTPSTPSTSTCCTAPTDTTTSGTRRDYAHHLVRRARGLPFWFSLATHGTDAYARRGRDDARRHPPGCRADRRAAEHLELVMEPELSIVLFRRLGWTAADYQRVERRPAAPRRSRSSRRRRGATRRCCAGAS